MRTDKGPIRSHEAYARQADQLPEGDAADLIRELRGNGEPLVITQNGEAAAVMQEVASCEATQETLALLKILVLGRRQVEEGRTIAAEEVFRRLRKRRARGSRRL